MFGHLRPGFCGDPCGHFSAGGYDFFEFDVDVGISCCPKCSCLMIVFVMLISMPMLLDFDVDVDVDIAVGRPSLMWMAIDIYVFIDLARSHPANKSKSPCENRLAKLIENVQATSREQSRAKLVRIWHI